MRKRVRAARGYGGPREWVLTATGRLKTVCDRRFFTGQDVVKVEAKRLLYLNYHRETVLAGHWCVAARWER